MSEGTWFAPADDLELLQAIGHALGHHVVEAETVSAGRSTTWRLVMEGGDQLAVKRFASSAANRSTASRP